jgi:LPXTG-site transpeptidase (sortase) family protein
MDVQHGDPTGQNSATNPANYLLVSPGTNGVFDTTACGPVEVGGLMPDDVQIHINSVSYDQAPFTATLNINNGTALPKGSYRLFICGTTSIADASGKVYLNNELSDSLVSFKVTSTTHHSGSGSGSSTSQSSGNSTLPATGFAPGRISALPIQAAPYADLGDLWLEIPSLGVKTTIVGVPQSDDETAWDVSWLGNQAGWLNGTAFPSWSGNSVITGHVWDANNKPGLFVNLKQLKYGDQVKIHAWGQVYTYEVRDAQLVSPANVDTALQHEDQAWVTLVTCEDFSPLNAKYSYRRIVRSVLVRVTAEK